MPELVAAAGRCSLDESPGTNWIEQNGGLPNFICRIAVHLQDTMGTSHAIATAINAAKKMCATGDLNFPGVQNVNPGSRAEACKAVAEWEALKARAHAHRVGAAAGAPAEILSLIRLVDALSEGNDPMRAFTRDIARAGVPDAGGNTLTAAAAVRAAGLPLPIHQVDRDGQVRLVGRVLSLSYADGVLTAAGQMFYPDIDEAGLTVDYADALVQVTAEGSASISSMLVAGLTVKALSASVTGDTGLPIAEPADRPWDADAARAHILAWATGADGKVDPDKLAQGFLWRDDDADPATIGAYKLPFADVINGSLQIVPAGVSAALGAMSGARGGVQGLSSADRDAIQGRLDALDKRVRSVTAGAAVLDAAPASAPSRFAGYARPLNPPRSFFTDPKLPGPTPPTITADGEFYGHAADWTSCHRSFVAAGLCLTPPRSHCDYCEFKTSTVLTAEGDMLRVGAFSFGGGHADLAAGKAEATAHYADVGSVVALVAAGEDEHGIWLHGAITPTATDEQLYGLLAYPPSGDWREPRPGDPLEMIAVCSVAHPGYNVQAHVAAGTPVALVIPYGGSYPPPASGNTATDTPDNMAALSASLTPTITPELAALRASAVDVIAASIGRDRATQLAELDLLVHPS